VDNVTHTLFAITLARTPLARAGRGTLPALVLASNAPDVDIISTLGGSPSYLQWHRGSTHGPIGVIGLSLGTAGLVWLGRRALDRRRAGHGTPTAVAENASFRMLLSVSLVAAVGHVLMDLATSYGTRVLSPIDRRWFAVDWLPITDVYLLVTLVAGLVIGEISSSSRRRLAAIVLVVMAANYGVRAVAHRQALALAPRLFGPLLPQPCDPLARPSSLIAYWPRERNFSEAGTGKPCLVEIAAVPTFSSPFRWRVIAHLSNAYELHEIDVLDGRFLGPASTGEVFWRRAVRYPDVWTPSTFAAAATPTARTFLGFSRFPAARSLVNSSGVATVRWSDMRFVGGLTANAPRAVNMFTVLVRIGPDGRVLEEALGR
jgi:membrane-bound metal-dependent hydrolase YbcI (DUF457 family)